MATTENVPQNPMHLTGFQRDLLFAIAAHYGANGLEVKEVIEAERGGEILNGRLYANLDAVADAGYGEKGSRDGRTNEYTLTKSGREALEGHHKWERDCLEGVVA